MTTTTGLCPTCGSDRVALVKGVLHDVAVYPNARYLRGAHAPTCAANVAARNAYRDEVRQTLTATADSYRSLIAQGLTHLEPRLAETEAQIAAL